jgi:hypothetical protein
MRRLMFAAAAALALAGCYAPPSQNEARLDRMGLVPVGRNCFAFDGVC